MTELEKPPVNLDQLSVEQLVDQAHQLIGQIKQIAAAIARKGDFQESNKLLKEIGFFNQKQ